MAFFPGMFKTEAKERIQLLRVVGMREFSHWDHTSARFPAPGGR
jgi:hypothetical protein